MGITRKSAPILLALLLAGVALAAPSPAGHDDDFDRETFRQERRLERMVERLDLDRDQAEAIDAVLDAAREDARASRQRLHELRRAIHELLQAETVDETAVRQRFAEKAALEAEAAIRRDRVRRDVLDVLDDEQREQLAELREARLERREERRDDRREFRRQHRREHRRGSGGADGVR